MVVCGRLRSSTPSRIVQRGLSFNILRVLPHATLDKAENGSCSIATPQNNTVPSLSWRIRWCAELYSDDCPAMSMTDSTSHQNLNVEVLPSVNQTAQPDSSPSHLHDGIIARSNPPSVVDELRF